MKKKCFNKYESVAHVSISICQGLFRNTVFRSVALVTKLWAILDFFSKDWTFYVLYPTLCIKKKFTKNPLNYYSLKVTKFHDGSVKNESARIKKIQEGGGRQTPPACLGLTESETKVWILLIFTEQSTIWSFKPLFWTYSWEVMRYKYQKMIISINLFWFSTLFCQNCSLQTQ